MKLSSVKQTILLISDVHQDIEKVRYLLKKENYDIVVSLGDWFDSRHKNSEKDTEDTCKFIKEWIFKPNFFTCMGNHDIQYFYGNPATICTGYNSKRDLAITKMFGSAMPAIREKFLWYLWVDDFFCSHAGLNPVFLNPFQEITKSAITKWLDDQIKIAEPSLINNGIHWLFGVGKGRGGRQRAGGLTWNCFESEFQPIDGLKQLVGHTNHSTIVTNVENGNLDLTEAQNLDIDCHLNEYVMIFNGKLTIKKFSDL